MSWQSYIDDSLMCTLPAGSTLESAAIFGQDGNVWAQSAEFPAVRTSLDFFVYGDRGHDLSP